MSDRDVAALPFMPLFVDKLLASDTWSMASGDEAKAAVTLWARAWKQVPAGSLPRDDKVLAGLSGAGAKWGKVRDVALRGFKPGEDGRLHHELIEQAADDALAKLAGQRTRTAAATAKRQEQRQKVRHVERYVERDEGRNDAPEPQRNVVQREREREGQSVPTVASLPAEPQGGLPVPLEPPGPAAPKTRRTPAAGIPNREAKGAPVWQAYSVAYALRYGVEPVRNAGANSHCCQLVDKLGAEAPMVAAHYLRSTRGLYVSARHALNLLVRDAESLRTEWATGIAMTDTQARQADRTAATANVFNALRTEVRDGTTG